MQSYPTGPVSDNPPAAVDIRHGIPDDLAGLLPELLAEARRLLDLGTPPDDVRTAVLQINRTLPRPMPAYSPGGLAECIDAVLGKGGTV